MHAQCEKGSWDHNGKFYILPICQKHYSNKELDCGDNNCSKYATTKKKGTRVAVEQMHIQQFRNNNRQHQLSSKGVYQSRIVKQIRSVKEAREIFHANNGPILLLMTGCCWCPSAFDKFARNARQDNKKHYYSLVDVENMKGGRKFLVEDFGSKFLNSDKFGYPIEIPKDIPKQKKVYPSLLC